MVHFQGDGEIYYLRRTPFQQRRLRRVSGIKSAVWAAAVLILTGCAARPPVVGPRRLPLMGYSIQAGAFTNLDNAVRLTESLKKRGQGATFFRDDDGLYKVRFGNFGTRELANQGAESLRQNGIIEVYYIVTPEHTPAAERDRLGDAYVREQIVGMAESFLGLPYRWGGTSAKTGFDCSGLTMTAYRLNGFDMPRTSREQFRTGMSVHKSRLSKGDLVFFATAKKKSVSHVGIYIGNGHFIHAPGRGKIIRIDALSKNYYQRNYLGARTYL